jgi:hypothetical protein
MKAKRLLNLLEVQPLKSPIVTPIRGEGRSVYDYAVSLRYPYIRGFGKAKGNVWMSRFTKTPDGTGPAVYVGWNPEAKKFEVEHEGDRE